MLYVICVCGMAGSLFLLAMVARLTDSPLFLWAAGVIGGLYAAAIYLEAIQGQAKGGSGAWGKALRTRVNRFYAWQDQRARARAEAKAAKAQTSVQPNDVWPSRPPKAPPFRASFEPDDKPKQGAETMPVVTISLGSRSILDVGSIREAVIEFARERGYVPYEGEQGYILRGPDNRYYRCRIA